MIRINLLRRERRKERRPAAKAAPSETVKQLGFLAIFLLTVAVGAWLWFDIQGRKADLDTQTRAASAERERLKSIKELVDRLELEREKLALRLDVLSDLKNNLRTPLYAVFYLYIAQQNRPDVIIDEIRQKTSESESMLEFTVKGEATDENLNRFLDELAAEVLVTGVDIVSATGNKFEINIAFHPLSSLAGEEGQGSAEGEAGG
ncbi:MAG TPA: hypothetical protein VMX35_02415 [Acidobacteriota bacterium]|nr:hypothetical protein [Acidobacteriota bacterium]